MLLTDPTSHQFMISGRQHNILEAISNIKSVWNEVTGITMNGAWKAVWIRMPTARSTPASLVMSEPGSPEEPSSPLNVTPSLLADDPDDPLPHTE